MSLLENVVAGVIKNSLGNQNQQGGSDLGSLLGSVLGGQSNQASQGSQGGLGSILGSVVASQLGGNQSQNSGLGGVLGSLLGGGQSQSQTQASPTDLGSVLGSLLGSQQNSQGGLNKNALLLALLPIVLGYIQKNGGLSGVLAKFNNNGLGNKAQSWVNVDTDNDGIDAQDVLGLFGQEEIQKACQQTGASQNDVCQGIAELLPQVVNDLTPDGTLDNENVANDEISQLLQQFANASK